jgi:hypothetical protein
MGLSELESSLPAFTGFSVGLVYKVAGLHRAAHGQIRVVVGGKRVRSLTTRMKIFVDASLLYTVHVLVPATIVTSETSVFMVHKMVYLRNTILYSVLSQHIENTMLKCVVHHFV